MLPVNVARYHTTNRTASSNGPISQVRAAGLRKYVYEDGITVMERISGTLLRIFVESLGGGPVKRQGSVVISEMEWAYVENIVHRPME